MLATWVLVGEGEHEAGRLLLPDLFPAQDDASFRLAKAHHVRRKRKVLQRKFNHMKTQLIQRIGHGGREPWSSGYGRWLMPWGRGFESRRRKLDGHDLFSHWSVVKNCIVCWKRPPALLPALVVPLTTDKHTVALYDGPVYWSASTCSAMACTQWPICQLAVYFFKISIGFLSSEKIRVMLLLRRQKQQNCYFCSRKIIVIENNRKG